MIVSISTCKAQDSINTPKVVLEYLYKQDIKATYLAKDTARLVGIINYKDSVLNVCSSQIENRQAQVNVLAQEIDLNNVQIDVLNNEVKQSNRKTTLYKITTLGATILGLFGTAYFIVH